MSDITRGYTFTDANADWATNKNTAIRLNKMVDDATVNLVAGSNITIFRNDSGINISAASGGAGSPGYYGAFHDTTDQVAAAANTAYAINLNTTDESIGVSIVSGNRITIANGGTYDLQFSLQLKNTDSQIHDVNIWLRKNGVDVAATNSIISVPEKHGSVDGHILPAWNFVFTAAANDYYQLMWSTANTAVSVETIAAGTSPTTPLTPSAIITVTQVVNIAAPGSITGSQIANGTITGNNIANATITGINIQNGTISAANIQNATITGAKIDNATITGANIATATISGTNIGTATISGTNIASSTISGSNIAANTISGSNIASSTISGSNIAAQTISASNLVNGTITASQIANLTITAAQIDNLTINGSKIASDAITNTKIADSAVTNTKVQDATLTGSKLANATITALQIANATITSTQIANATITGSKIDNATITGSNIANATITSSQIASATITGSNIASSTITGSNIASATITGDKIGSATITGANISSATITAANIQSSTITADKIASATITANEIANLTITGGKIANSTITNAKIDTLEANKITAGTITATISLQSPLIAVAGACYNSASYTSNTFASTTLTVGDDGTTKPSGFDATSPSYLTIPDAKLYGWGHGSFGNRYGRSDPKISVFAVGEFSGIASGEFAAYAIEYSTDGGTTWGQVTAIDASAHNPQTFVSVSGALELTGMAALGSVDFRFKLSGTNGGNPTFEYGQIQVLCHNF
jgi:uncharacterized protein YjbI with pentapeptide repeats